MTKNLGYRATWTDGYLPSLQEMRSLAARYKKLDIDEMGTCPYGFSQAGPSWTREDFFSSMAAAMRNRFDAEELPGDVQPAAPCCMWLARFGIRPNDPSMESLYRETVADPRGDDYYHLIHIRDECPVGDRCTQTVVCNLHFEIKPKDAYADYERFARAASEILEHYLDIVSAPWQEVERLLQANASTAVSGGP